ncbi:MAG: cupin domain-containing protein [Ectothiorhodospiraceae bacterium]|jgi:50S ribosomal protein L16 3-hydroxylase
MSGTTHLGGLSASEFLEQYWQKRPLLVRGAFGAPLVGLSGDELAGLAGLEDVESRIVRGNGRDEAWELEHGPFPADRFDSLPDRDWTLLVQDVDKHLPAMAALLEPFRFVPDWRIDDLMVSFAAPGGSVGPHVDQYDVFLIQAEGRRRWQIQSPPPVEERPSADSPLRLVEGFAPTHDWMLEPGDMLYLPPGIPHWGVAETPCLTYSVGFRAPAVWEMVAGWMDECLNRIGDEPRYSDPDLRPQANPGEIPPAALARMRSLIRQHLDAGDTSMDRFLGRMLTEVKPGFANLSREVAENSDSVARRLADGETLLLNPAARAALVRYDDDHVFLFINGIEYRLGPQTLALGQRLSGDHRLTRKDVNPSSADDARQLRMVTDWVNAGFLLYAGEWESHQ